MEGESSGLGFVSPLILGGLRCCTSGRVAAVTAVECGRSGAPTFRAPEMPVGLGEPGYPSVIVLVPIYNAPVPLEPSLHPISLLSHPHCQRWSDPAGLAFCPPQPPSSPQLFCSRSICKFKNSQCWA